MTARAWAATAAAAGTVAAALTLAVVLTAQRHYDRAFAFRIARTTAAYVAAVTPPPPPPPPPRVSRRLRGQPPPPPSPPPSSTTASRSYDLPSLLTQARALRTLPGWSSDVEVYFGTAPLIDATAPPLSPDDLAQLESPERGGGRGRGGRGGRWRAGAAIVPLRDREGQEVVGAVAVRPRPSAHGPLPGGFGFAFPAALLAVVAAAVIAFRERSLRRGGYAGAALLLALAAFLDVHYAARQSTDRWLFDTRRLLQEAATRLPPPRARVAITDLAALVQDGEIVAGEPAESPARRVRIDGEPRAVVAVLIGPQRWVELRSVPAEREAPRWLLLLMPAALLGPLTIMGLRWAERTPARRRRETAVAWAFLSPAALHLLIFTVGPALYAFYLASSANFRALVRDPLTWNAAISSAGYALYVPISVTLALILALGIHRFRNRWGGRLLRAVVMMPYVSSIVAIALLWQAIFHAGSLGAGRPDWLANPNTALLALMLVSVWAHVGGQMLVFLAGLHAIPTVYFDAARVDGAGLWRGFWRVTVPLLRPVTWFVALTGVLGAFQMFTLAYVLTQGGPFPLHSTDVLVHRVYRTAFGPQALGLASALAVMLALISLLFRWPQLRLLRGRAADGVGGHA